MGTLLVTCAACISHLCSFLHWCLTLMYGLNPSSTPFSKSNGFDSLSYPVHLQAKFAEHQLLHFLPGILFGYLSQQLGSWWYEIFLHQKLLVFVRGVSFLKLHPWSECKISGWPKVEKILISSPVIQAAVWSESGTASAHSSLVLQEGKNCYQLIGELPKCRQQSFAKAVRLANLWGVHIVAYWVYTVDAWCTHGSIIPHLSPCWPNTPLAIIGPMFSQHLDVQQ